MREDSHKHLLDAELKPAEYRPLTADAIILNPGNKNGSA